MAGQIIKRGENRWLVRIFLGRDAQGKRRYFNKTIRGTKKNAQTYLTGALRRLDLGEPIEQTDQSFSDFLKQWLQVTEQRVKPRTLEIYQDIAERFLKPALGKHKLANVGAADIQKLYANLAERGLSGKTIALIHAVLTHCFRRALKWDLIRRNPMVAVDPPRIERREMKSLTAEQARAFLQAADEGLHGCLLAFLLATGCRPSEALALKWSDVNLSSGSVTIQRNLTRLIGGKWVFSDPKTARGRRTIPLAGGMLKRLSEHRRRQNEARLKAGSEWQNHDLVFCSPFGEPNGEGLIRHAFLKAIKRAKLPAHFRPYDLRHSAASLLIAAGLSPKAVSERLGHAHIAITLEVYSHTLPGVQEQASERLEKLLFG